MACPFLPDGCTQADLDRYYGYGLEPDEPEEWPGGTPECLEACWDSWGHVMGCPHGPDYDIHYDWEPDLMAESGAERHQSEYRGKVPMTKEQKAFIARLKRLLKDIPDSIELIVRYGSIDVCEMGARAAYFDEHGDTDNVPYLENVPTKRVFPGGESL